MNCDHNSVRDASVKCLAKKNQSDVLCGLNYWDRDRRPHRCAHRNNIEVDVSINCSDSAFSMSLKGVIIHP
jgi:hypothetical protein